MTWSQLTKYLDLVYLLKGTFSFIIFDYKILLKNESHWIIQTNPQFLNFWPEISAQSRAWMEYWSQRPHTWSFWRSQFKQKGHQLEIAWMYEKGDKALGPESRPKPISPHVSLSLYILQHLSIAWKWEFNIWSWIRDEPIKSLNECNFPPWLVYARGNGSLHSCSLSVFYHILYRVINKIFIVNRRLAEYFSLSLH